MQTKPRSRGSRHAFCVEIIAKNRMPNREHVDAQLMTSTGARKESNPRPRKAVGVTPAFQHFVGRETRLPFFVVHDLSRASECFLSKRKVHLTEITRDMPGDKRLVLLLNLAGLERHRQRTVRHCITRKHNDA